MIGARAFSEVESVCVCVCVCVGVLQTLFLTADDPGLCQRRERLFIIGFRNDLGGKGVSLDRKQLTLHTRGREREREREREKERERESEREREREEGRRAKTAASIEGSRTNEGTREGEKQDRARWELVSRTLRLYGPRARKYG